jgi:hypothetical protein
MCTDFEVLLLIVMKSINFTELFICPNKNTHTSPQQALLAEAGAEEVTIHCEMQQLLFSHVLLN